MPQTFEGKGYGDECPGKDRSGNIPLRVLQVFRHQRGREWQECHQEKDQTVPVQ